MPRPEHDGATVLVVEDDQAFAEMLRDGLSAAGYRVCLAPTGAAAQALVESVKVDVILVDLMLPDEHGLLVCANLSQRFSGPIIICSGTRRKEDAALAFKLGATDFVPKPVLLNELEIRIQRALHRPRPDTRSNRHRVTTLGPLALDQTRRLVTVAGQELATTPTEYRLLTVLLERADEVVSIDELAEAVWGHYDSTLAESLRVHVRRVRAKLRTAPVPTPELIAVRGFGYRLVWNPLMPTPARP